MIFRVESHSVSLVQPPASILVKSGVKEAESVLVTIIRMSNDYYVVCQMPAAHTSTFRMF
jgi:hypothetical protein